VPDKYTTGPSASDLQTAVTARIWLLMRTAKPEAGYTDTKTYTMANMGTFGPANDHYRRRVYTTTVQLRNPNNTNGPCVQAPAASATSTR
jgi:type IV pilus assembly protein PilW